MPSFLDLPVEIRRMIYPYCMDPNEYKRGYDKIERHSKTLAEERISEGTVSDPDCLKPRIYITRTTPAVLLLNKQITAEALEILYKIPVELRGTPGTHFTMRQMGIAEFICEQLLQRIQYATLRLNRPHKSFVLTLLDIWGADNRLKRLDVYFPKGIDRTARRWAISENRLRTFSLVAPVYSHEVDMPSERILAFI
ncbi:hypothetical protein BDV38DRAFT_279873 [Aspergillus pseudotamarii]|uniref:Uncharacterized protein n=1 Tax=Aspergillus pseudotamarii TaxID=132259 RepID=A0A5N6T3M0_ASPPS|nr:uncharacterized protein BDV38DRAFT_279873 [Aspergillus pseudotamarii]KAE8140897.1 hypothetical protein BDV38DRAFT_279873 [Aspergillus pseudotamarii]